MNLLNLAGLEDGHAGEGPYSINKNVEDRGV